MDVQVKVTVIQKLYEIEEKRSVVQQSDDLVSSGFTHCQASGTLEFPLLYYSHWKKLIEKVDDINAGGDFVSYNMKAHLVRCI